MITSKTLTISVGVVALFSAGFAAAAKVNLPQEGSFEFDFCLVSETMPPLKGGDKFFVSHYKNAANIRTDPPGKPFDRQSAFCYGTFAALNGRNQDFGICEATDADGDVWWLEYHGNPDGAGGTYTSPYGTGKYEGMTVKAQYALDAWPGTTRKEIFQGCFHNKGTYKLK
jgi:hypothetical protein